MDVLYTPTLKGAQIGVPDDPSACLQSFPKTWFVLDSLSKFEMPLWNDLSGCGQPILADLANCLFHPINLLFGVENQKLYNLGLIAKILASTIASYIWFLRRGAVPWAAASAAIGFGLYARALHVNELANTSMIPLVFLSFDLLTEKIDKKKVAISAALIGLSYYCMHPESFFISAGAAFTVWILEAALGEHSSSAPEKSKAEKSKGMAINLLLVFLLSLSFAAPTLLPFLEFLPLAHTYKFADTFSQYISIEQIASYLANPKIENNLFAGACTLLALPAFIIFESRKRFALITIVTFALLFQCRPLNLLALLQTAPFSYVLPEYSIAVIVLLLCLFSALGLTALGKTTIQPLKWYLSAALGTMLCIIPLAVAGISAKLILSTSILCAVTLGILFWFRLESRQLALFIIPIVNLISLWTPSHQAIYKGTYLDFPPESRQELINAIKDAKPTRFMACGDRLLIPNTTLIYGLPDFRTDTPLNARAYVEFLKGAGAHVGYCNLVEVPTELNKFYDLASVDVIASELPIRSKGDIPSQTKNQLPSRKGRIAPGLRILQTAISYIPSSQELDTTITLRLHLDTPNRYQMQYLLIDQNNEVCWSSKFEFLHPTERTSEHNLVKVAHLPVPNRAQNLSLVLKFLDGWSHQEMIPDGTTLGKESNIRIADFSAVKVDSVRSEDKRFEVLHETADGLRVYRNKHALPLVYASGNVTVVDDETTCISRISSPDFNPMNEIVLVNSPTIPTQEIKSGQENEPTLVEILEHSKQRLTVKCKNRKPACLVYTDLFYPGWRAYVNGVPTTICKANYLFKAVIVKPGENTITFSYEPPYLVLSWLLFGASSFVCIGCLLAKRQEKQKCTT